MTRKLITLLFILAIFSTSTFALPNTNTTVNSNVPFGIGQNKINGYKGVFSLHTIVTTLEDDNTQDRGKTALYLEEYADFEWYLGKGWKSCQGGTTLQAREWNRSTVKYGKYIVYRPKKQHHKEDLKVKLQFNKGICTSIHIYRSDTSLNESQIGDYKRTGEYNINKTDRVRLYQNGNRVMSISKIKYVFSMYPQYDTEYFLLVNGKNKQLRKFKRIL